MRLIRDPFWWGALACGPLFWIGLWLAGAPLQPAGRLAQHWQAVLLVVLVYPVLEEIVFRGGLQGWLSGHLRASGFPGISPANLITSVAFTAMHFIYHPPLWAASVFAPSLVFGFFRDRYRAIYASILLHIFYNSGYAILFMSF